MGGRGLLNTLGRIRSSGRSPRRCREIIKRPEIVGSSFPASTPPVLPLSPSSLDLSVGLGGSTASSGFRVCDSPVDPLDFHLPPFPIAMASFFPVRPVCSAVRKQSTTLPRSLSSSTQPIAPSSGSCSHFSSLCSTSRLMNSRKLSSDTANPILVGNLATREEKRRDKNRKKKRKEKKLQPKFATRRNVIRIPL